MKKYYQRRKHARKEKRAPAETITHKIKHDDKVTVTLSNGATYILYLPTLASCGQESIEFPVAVVRHRMWWDETDVEKPSKEKPCTSFVTS